MDALQWQPERRALSLVRIPRPQCPPPPGRVLVRVVYASVCGSDVSVLKCKFGDHAEVVLGHEFCGRVVAVGADVSSPSVGDPVTINPQPHCGQCSFCMDGKMNLCSIHGILSYRGIFCDGGFTELVEIAAKQAVVLPATLPLSMAFLCEPLATVSNGHRILGEVKATSKVWIMGAGVTGLLFALLFRYHGVHDICITQRSKVKLLVAQNIGLGIRACQPSDIDDEMKGKNADEDGFDIIVDATGNVSAIEHAMQYARKGCRLVIYGVTEQNAELKVRPFDILGKCLTILCSNLLNNTFDSSVEILANMCEMWGLNQQKLGIQQYDFGDYKQAFQDMMDSKITKALLKISDEEVE